MSRFSPVWMLLVPALASFACASGGEEPPLGRGGQGNGGGDGMRQGSAPRQRGDATRTTPGGRHNDRAEAVADEPGELPPGDRPLRHSSDSGDLD